MASQTSFRLPQNMLRALNKLARQRGVPKSQVVREAIEQYLAGSSTDQTKAMSVRERSAPYIGSITLSASHANDDVSVRIREHNWRG